MMRGTFNLFVGVVLVLAASIGTACGSPLLNDPAALVSGSQVFNTPVWTATVQYAVYAPGTYPGVQADKNSDYVYAYQVFSDVTSLFDLDAFSVALVAGSGAVDAGFDSSYGTLAGVNPLLSRLTGTPPSTAAWTYDVPAGQHSSVFTFASPNTFTWASANVANGGSGNSHLLPSPNVPEPTTICLLVLGGLAAVRRRVA